MNVTGSKWGLACSSIHLIDLFQFLTESKLKPAELKLSDDVIESKRSGYIEINGEIDIHTDQNDLLKLECSDDKSAYMNVNIKNDEFEVEIKETEGIIVHQKIKYNSYYQSELTERYIDDILDGHCDLTKIEDSEMAHMSLMDPLNEFLQAKKLLTSGKQLPIT